MNEQLQTKMVEILSGIQTATKTAGDFALEQLPDIAQSYIIYGRVSLTMLTLFFLGLTVLSAWVALKKGFLANTVDKYGDWSVDRVFAATCATIAALCLSIAMIISAMSAMLVWFFPKAWLLREFASLMK